MTDYDSHAIIRVGKGSDDPLDPKRSTQSDYSKQFKDMLIILRY